MPPGPERAAPLVTPDAERAWEARRVLWHTGALAVFTLAAVLTMRPWLDPDLLPVGDFPGFAAEVEWTRVRLDRDHTLPVWTPERFGGSTRFMSNLKEIAAYPLARQLGAVQGTKVMFLLMRILAAFGMYLVCARCLRTPAAGLPAGYAYGFGAPANLQATLGGHLDLAISCALFPLLLLAATALLQRRRARDAVWLGTLAAVEFCAHSYLQAMIVPVIFLLLLVLRPWRPDPRAEDVRAEPGLARRWLGLTAGAVAVFLLLGASQAAWLAADLSNHTLHSPETVAHGVQTYVEHTPFLYVNRNDWLGGWLQQHAPPRLELYPNFPLYNQRRYLGLVALALCVVGWGLARSDFSLRRWFQTFLLLFAFQYWMSIGPQTLVWQLGRSFHWSTTVDGLLRGLLTVGGVACLGSALVLARRRWGDPAGVPFGRVELALGLGLVQLLAAHSLFGFFYAAVPVLRGMRSPGHFFDLAPFAFYAMLGVAIAAGLRRVASRARPAIVVAIAFALVVDFLPTLAGFRLRRDAGALAAMRQSVSALPGDEGTLRIALSPAYAPPGASLVTAAADAGSAWNWLYWQAGRYWQPYLASAMASLSPDVNAGDQLARRIGNALQRSGRLAYLLEEYGGQPSLRVGPPWQPMAEQPPFALWHGPPVLPMGTVFGSFALLVGGTVWDQGASIADAFERGVVTVAGGDRLSDNAEDTVAAAGAVRAVGPALDDPASRALGARHAAALLTPGDPTAPARWETFLAGQAARPPSAARYVRPAPDRMVFDLDADSRSTVLFVSEAWHPWWRAAVDGEVADVLRAQLAFMAVRLPAGARHVELAFRPPFPVVAADRITQGASLALAVAALLLVGRRALSGPRAPRPGPPGAPSSGAPAAPERSGGSPRTPARR